VIQQSKNAPSITFSFIVLLLALITILTPSVLARTGTIAALSTSGENATVGDVIDIALQVQPGRGAIYIESMPLTRLDTQMSARLAVEAACERSAQDCRQYDFFYVIRTSGGVIGGPSAGAALAVLTYAVLEEIPIRNNTAITGAILPGGVIGPVGSVQEKVRGAARAGYSVALVPAFDSQDDQLLARTMSDSDAYTRSGITRSTYQEQGTTRTGETTSVTVIRIATLDDAIYHFTGRAPPRVAPLSAPPEAYTKDMARIATTLCERALITRSTLDEDDLAPNETRLREAERQYNRAMESIGRGAFYTGASQCFGSSLIAQQLLLETASNETRRNVLDMVQRGRTSMREAIEKAELTTITDLEVAMIATARLSDVERALREMNTSNPSPSELAYASERLETARAWFGIIGNIESKSLDLSQDALDASCRQKLDEARERVNYASYLFPQSAPQLEESVREAFSAAQRQHSALCILQASQAKAEANALLTALSVPEQDFEAVTQRKAMIARERIAAQTARGTFPILAYSYVEYADAFSGGEAATRALYTEYALELAMLPNAFTEQRSILRVDNRMSIVFGLGVVAGIVLGLIGGFALYHTPKQREPESKKSSTLSKRPLVKKPLANKPSARRR